MRRRPVAVVLSCEHGGHRVPAEHRSLFVGAGAVLRSHRGWDRGALVLARAFGRSLQVPLFEATVTRLLVDLNRSETNRAVFSSFTSGLPVDERQALLAEHHRPHRLAVRAAVAEQIALERCVLHVSVHSFTPVLDGRVRTTDVGLLYDPARESERRHAAAWKTSLEARLPRLAIHCNAPYRGTSDGLTRWLRTQFSARDYAGLELELNQRFVEGGTWAKLRCVLVDSLEPVLA